MSSDIEKKIVEIEFQNRNFEKGVKQTQKSIESLNKSLEFKNAEKSIDTVQKALTRMQLDSIEGNVKKISDRFSELGIVGVTALTRISNAAITTGKNLVKSLTIDPVLSGFQEYETQMNAVQTILANTSSKGTTLEQVTAALDELNHYADKTIYNFTEMTRNIGTFTAAGVDLKTSVSAIQGIANLAAVSGSNAQQASTAMYQLSQALAAGRVSLMDWNSVVNAGMGGEVFQQALRKVSQELGTGAEAAIAAKGSFRESLQTGWLTAEVLTETLNKFTKSGAQEWVADYTGLTKEAVAETLKAAEAEYGEAEAIEEASKQLAEKSGKNQQEIKDVLEMAKTAEDAATKVKTFSQLMDTLKEAVQSGWTETWNTVIGDFEEAKELFTGISDVLGDVIQRSADLRNNMLKVWKDLGGRTKLFEGLKNISMSILNIWKSISQAFYDVFGVVGKELYALTEEFANFTKELVANEQTLEDIKRVVRGVASVLNIFTQIISAVARAVLQIFVYLKPLISRVLHLLAILGDAITIFNYVIKQTQIFNRLGQAIARTLLLIGQILANLARLAAAVGLIAFRSIFLVIQAIISLYKTINDRFGGIGGLVSKVIGTLVKRFPELGNILNDLEPMFKDFGKNLGQFVGSIKSAFGGALNIIKGFSLAFLKSIGGFFDSLSSLDSLSLDGIKYALLTFSEAFQSELEKAGVDLTALKEAFKSFGEIVSNIFRTVLSVVGPIITTITNLLNNLFSTLGLKTTVAIVLLSLLVASIFKLISGLGGAFGNVITAVADGIKDISKSITGYLDAKAMNERSEAIKNLGVAIALMAGSLIMLTFVDQEKLKSSAIVLGSFAAGLIVVSTAANIFTGWLAKKGKITETSMSGFTTSLIGIAVSMLLVIKAVANMQAEMNKTRAYGDATFVDAMWSLIGAFAVLATLATIMSVVTSKWAPGSAKVAISYALQMLAVVQAIKQLSDPSLDLDKGLTGLTGVAIFLITFMGVEVIASKFSSGAGQWKNALASVLALRFLLSTMLKINEISTERIMSTLGKSLMVIFAFRLVMKAASKAGGNDSSKTIQSVALAFLGLVLAMQILSKMNPEEITRGTKGVSLMMIPMAILMLISNIGRKKVETSTKTIMAMSGAIAVMALCAALLSLIDPEGLVRGTVSISIMAAIMGGVIALTKFVNKTKNGIKSMKTMAIIIGVLALSAGLLSKLDMGGLIAAFSGISLVLGMMTLVFLSIKNLDAKAALALVAMVVPIGAIAGALAMLAQADVGASIETAIGFSVLLLSLALCMKILSKINPQGILYGCIGLLAIGVTLLALFALFGLIFMLMGDGSFIINGAQLLGECIGALIGGILGGIGVGVAASFPMIGTYLSQFMENIQGFLKGSDDAKDVDFGSMFALVGLITTMSISAPLAMMLPMLGDGIGSLGTGLQEFMKGTEGVDPSRMEVIGQLISGIGNLAFGMAGFQSANLKSFGEGLPALAESIISFSNAMLGEDGKSAVSVEAAEEGAKIFAAVAKVASQVPRTGGWIGAIFGDVDLSGFVEAMGQAGPAVKSFHDNVSGLEYKNVEEGLKILEKTIEVASNVPNSGGLLGAIAGENNLDAFTEMMVSAGPDIADFVDKIKDVKYKNVEEGLKILEKTISVAQNIPNSGDSFVKFFVGDNTLEDFAEQMASAGPNITTFIEAMPDDLSEYPRALAAVSLLGDLIAVASGIKNESGWEKFWNGGGSLTNFGSDLAEFAPHFKTFWSEMSGIDLSGEDLLKKTEAVIAFLDGASQLAGLGDVKLPDLSQLVGENTIYAFATGMVNAAKNETTLKAIESTGSGLINALGTSLKGDAVAWTADTLIGDLSNSMSDSISKNSDFYVSIGEDILKDIGLGFIGKPMDELVKTLSDGLVNGVKKSLGIESPSKEFQEIGRYIIEGLDLGLQNGTPELQKATSRMSSTIENQFREDMGIHSPSSLFSKFGGFIIDGLKNGLSSGGSMEDIMGNLLGGMDFNIFGDYASDMQGIFSGVFDTVDLGDFTMEGLDDGSFVDGLMSKVQDQIDNQGLTAEIDAVFDADSMQSQIDGMTGTITTTGTGGAASATMSSFTNTQFDDSEQEASGGQNTFSFVQNNYSPTELDRIAIYRQTRNQFAAMKEVINKI